MDLVDRARVSQMITDSFAPYGTNMALAEVVRDRVRRALAGVPSVSEGQLLQHCQELEERCAALTAERDATAAQRDELTHALAARIVTEEGASPPEGFEDELAKFLASLTDGQTDQLEAVLTAEQRAFVHGVLEQARLRLESYVVAATVTGG